MLRCDTIFLYLSSFRSLSEVRSVKQTLDETLEKDSSLLADDVTSEEPQQQQERPTEASILPETADDVTQPRDASINADSSDISQVLEQFSEILEEGDQPEVAIFQKEEEPTADEELVELVEEPVKASSTAETETELATENLENEEISSTPSESEPTIEDANHPGAFKS